MKAQIGPITVEASPFVLFKSGLLLWKALPRFQVVTGTKATLTLNSSEKGGDGGAPSECDNQCHSEKGGDGRNRCLNFIKIHGNGKSVKAMVVDECESTMRCDSDHDYQPPRDSDHDYQPPCDSDHDYQPSCANNIVDASKAGLESIRECLKATGAKWITTGLVHESPYTVFSCNLLWNQVDPGLVQCNHCITCLNFA
ncbi:RIPENING RELATED PROTEIN FAMILY [Salix viminalis]|uniref:RIPENING RELATED PROTEIN FAMILY n=1 Tax=Salix viminalis TaxID=40686 RepID=A0A9Q0SFQ2_SALVM|nr:RIPENING RELATED PROTEIN FAMILY [Salix viminalis]